MANPLQCSYLGNPMDRGAWPVGSQRVRYNLATKQQQQQPVHCVYVPMGIFFTHSSVDRHLGCFHVLAIVKSTAMNIQVHFFFKLRFYSDICLGVGLLDCW